MFVEAYSRMYDISLIILHLWARAPIGERTLLSLCETVQEISLRDLELLRCGGEKLMLGELSVNHIHAFRLSMAPFIGGYLNRPHEERPFCTLDLDDYESKLARRMAQAYAAAGDTRREELGIRRAMRFEAMEATYLPRFDQVYVCQERDRDEVTSKYRSGNVHVIPNAIRTPTADYRRPTKDTVTFLFVGTLDYMPNEDAAEWFCFEILPLIREKARLPFKVSIVGSRPSERVRRLATLPDVKVFGDVAEVSQFYDESVVSVVPIRVAGGTRIKILEAFSHSRPVIATSIGAEGLELVHDRQILIADTALGFASLCIDLLHDSTRRVTIGAEGFRWVRSYRPASGTFERITDLVRRSDMTQAKSVLCRSLEV